MDEYTLTSYNDFINRSFRDIADKDYIASRILYRLNLGEQFLWSSLQALEKYLKAILLYNDKSTIDILHNIKTAFLRLNEIKDIPFEFPSDISRYIEFINNQGNNRYLSYPAFTTGDELLMLDKTVWHIRKYCFYMKGESTPLPDGRRTDLFPGNVEKLRHFNDTNAIKFEIFGGFIEEVLKNKSRFLRLREILIWKNFYYGKNKKKFIKNFTKYSWSVNPSHFLNPEIYKIIKERVYFPKDVRNYFTNIK